MDKIILKAQNEEELNSMIKRSLTLGEDETYKVKVLKYPKKILFVSIKGEYEVEIVKKSQVEDLKNEHLKKRESKNENITLKPRLQTKNENKENDKKNSERRNSSSKDFQKNKIVKRKEENKETVSEKQIDANDANVSKIRSFIKEFLVNSKLEIVIVDIAKEGDKYIVNVDGKNCLANFTRQLIEFIFLLYRLFHHLEKLESELHLDQILAIERCLNLVQLMIVVNHFLLIYSNF